jgi:hypothetical protein
VVKTRVVGAFVLPVAKLLLVENMEKKK